MSKTCSLCNNTGLVFFSRVVKGIEYRNSVASCICPIGQRKTYDGRLCEKKPSVFFIPTMAQAGIEPMDIAKRRINDGWQVKGEVHGD